MRVARVGGPLVYSAIFRFALCVIFVVALQPSGASGCMPQDENSLLPTEPLVVQCLDPEGEPVAGADVYFFQASAEGSGQVHYHLCGPFKSAMDGRARCEERLFYGEERRFDCFVYARQPGEFVGGTRIASWARVTLESPRVRMVKCRDLTGTVTLPDEVDPTSIRIRVVAMHFKYGADRFAYDSLPRQMQFPGLEHCLPDRFEATPDSEGKFVITDVPENGRVYLEGTGEGVGESQWWTGGDRFSGPATLTFVGEAVLVGQVHLPDGQPAAGIEIVARMQRGIGFSPAHLSTYKTETDEKGTFRLAQMPHCELIVSTVDPEHELLSAPLEAIVVAPDETTEVDIRLETGVVVRGQVVDEIGDPVQGAAIYALADSENSGGLDHATSDESGRFKLRLPSGRAKFYFYALPEGFRYPDPQIFRRITIEAGQADFSLGKLVLERE